MQVSTPLSPPWQMMPVAPAAHPPPPYRPKWLPMQPHVPSQARGSSPLAAAPPLARESDASDEDGKGDPACGVQPLLPACSLPDGEGMTGACVPLCRPLDRKARVQR